MKRSYGFGIVLLSILLVACGSKYEDDFIRGCTSTGAKEAVCSCAFEHVHEVFTDEDLDHMQRTMEMPPSYQHVMVNAVLACRNE